MDAFENMKKKQQAELLEGEKSREKRKLKKKLKDEKKKQQWESYLKSKGRLISWENKDKMGIVFEGYFKDKVIFEIKKGIVTYSLRVKDKNIIKDSINKSSMRLDDLIKKAEKILIESIAANK